VQQRKQSPDRRDSLQNGGKIFDSYVSDVQRAQNLSFQRINITIEKLASILSR
jgi:hypothetical protein